MTNQYSKKIVLILLVLFIVAGGASGYYFRNDIPVIKDLIKSKVIPASEIKQESNTQVQIQQEKQIEAISEISKNTNPNESLGSVPNVENKKITETTKFVSKEVEIGGKKIIIYNSDSVKILYPANNTEVKVGDTLEIKIHISDFDKLQSYMLIFQGETIFTKPTNSDMVYKLIVSGEYIEDQTISVVANFNDGTKSFQSTDTKYIKVTPVETIKEFNIKPDVMVIEKGKSRRPDYEAIFPTAIAQIGETDLMEVSIKDSSVVSYDSKTNSFTALSKGETVADITYRGITNHMFINVIQYEEPVGDPMP